MDVNSCFANSPLLSPNSTSSYLGYWNALNSTHITPTVYTSKRALTHNAQQ